MTDLNKLADTVRDAHDLILTRRWKGGPTDKTQTDGPICLGSALALATATEAHDWYVPWQKYAAHQSLSVLCDDGRIIAGHAAKWLHENEQPMEALDVLHKGLAVANDRAHTMTQGDISWPLDLLQGVEKSLRDEAGQQ